MLAAIGKQRVGAFKDGLEDAFVDVVLVAPAPARGREQQVIELSAVAGLVLGQDVAQHGQQLDRAQPGSGLGAPDLEAAAGEVDISDERVAYLVVARPGQHKCRDEGVAARGSRHRVSVQLACRIEHRDDLIHTVEVDGAALRGLELAAPRVDADRIARE